MTENYIRPMLRGYDQLYHPSWDSEPPLPLRTFAAYGSWNGFRHMAWRSLIEYEPTDLAYECVTASRLADIQMQKEAGLDEGFDSRRELVTYPLLIVAILDSNVNSLTSSTLNTLLQEREAEAHPSWIFTTITGNALARLIGEEAVGRWFSSLRWFGVAAHNGPSVVSIAPPQVCSSDEPERPTADSPRQLEDPPPRGRSLGGYLRKPLAVPLIHRREGGGGS
jgi:hypothetical protein